jgi:hypothetical protein
VLFGKKVATAEELDKSHERLGIAVAEMDRAKAAKAEVEYQVTASEQTLKYHRARLADTRLISPFGNGLVLARYREVGDVVVPGTSVMDLVCLDEMWVSAWVDESEAVKEPRRAVDFWSRRSCFPHAGGSRRIPFSQRTAFFHSFSAGRGADSDRDEGGRTGSTATPDRLARRSLVRVCA